MDKLVDAYRDSIDEKERIDLAKKIQVKLQEIGSYVPTYMVPYVRAGAWRYWRLPAVMGTKFTDSLFDPFNSQVGGLFWLDEAMKKETEAAMKSGKSFGPVTKIDRTYEVK